MLLRVLVSRNRPCRATRILWFLARCGRGNFQGRFLATRLVALSHKSAPSRLESALSDGDGCQKVYALRLPYPVNARFKWAMISRPCPRLRATRRQRESAHQVPRFPHPLERRRPRHPNPEASEGRIRKAAVEIRSRRFATNALRSVASIYPFSINYLMLGSASYGR